MQDATAPDLKNDCHQIEYELQRAAQTCISYCFPRQTYIKLEQTDCAQLEHCFTSCQVLGQMYEHIDMCSNRVAGSDMFGANTHDVCLGDCSKVWVKVWMSVHEYGIVQSVSINVSDPLGLAYK